jgi:hypothetical protein
MLALTVMFSVAAGVASAQMGRATVLGEVTDQTGSVVAGAQIVVRHVESNVEYLVTSTPTGFYTLPDLPVGDYTIQVQMTGFKQAVRSGIMLRVGDRLQVNFQLEVGQVVETVEVIGQVSAVESSNATMGKIVEARQIGSLPLNGRATLALVTLTPNVRFSSTEPAGFGDRGNLSSLISVNGGIVGQNYLALDGVTNSSPRLNDINVNPAVDAVQEFKVESGVMSAEHGFTLGGVVNMVTRSGTNDFHGAAYEYLRNDILDARNTFSASKPPLRYNQYGFAIGGPVVRNKTFFFYNWESYNLRKGYTAVGTTPTAAQWEGDFSTLADRAGVPIPIYDVGTTRPNPSGSGYIRDRFVGNVIPRSRLDPVAVNYQKFYPVPNAPPQDPANTNNVVLNLGARTDTMQMTMKGDHHFSSANRMSIRFIPFHHKTDRGADGAFYFPDPVGRARIDDSWNYNLAITDTQFLSPSKFNDLRIGLVRQYFTYRGPSALQENPASSLGYPSSVPDIVIPRLTFQGTPNIQEFPTSPATFNGLIGFYTVQIQDGLTFVINNHTLKFGGEYRNNNYNNNACSTCSGSFVFNTRLTGNPQSLGGTGSGFASFLLGAAASASAQKNVGASYINWSGSGYIQDDWKINRRLTLNLGLRYDYQQKPGERNNGISNFNPFILNPTNGLLGRLEFAGLDFGRTVADEEWNDFGPRFGFAYDITGRGRTVVRGGYGIYQAIQGTHWANRFSTLGFAGNTTNYVSPEGNADLPALYLRNGFPFPIQEPLGSALGPNAFESQNVGHIESNTRTPYSQQFSLTLQQELPRSILIEAGYVGNKGTMLQTGNYDWNQLDPTYLSLGRSLQDRVPNPLAGRVAGSFGAATIVRQQLLRPYPHYNQVAITRPHLGNSTYHGFIVSAEKRYSKGLSFLASFTFGKLISDSVEAAFSFDGSEQISSLRMQNGKYNRAVERSIHGTDSGKRIVVSGVYELPFGQGKPFPAASSTANKFIGGWQVNGILTMQDGLPLEITGANNFVADRPNSTGVSAKLDNPTRDRWFNTQAFVNPPDFTFGNVGRLLPDVRGPRLAQTDLSVLKNTAITERFTLQFRAEMFNAFNQTNLFLPDTTFVPGPDRFNQSGSFGRITQSKPARVSQLALRFVF